MAHIAMTKCTDHYNRSLSFALNEQFLKIVYLKILCIYALSAVLTDVTLG